MTNPLLEIRDLRVSYDISGGLLRRAGAVLKAVDGVSLSVAKGELLALVGESGCGKSTIAKALVGLVEPTSGDVIYEGLSMRELDRKTWKAYRRRVQMIFQDPFDSLNPRKTVFQTIAQPLRIHGLVSRKELRGEVLCLLEAVGLSPAEVYIDRYPHQFSGGQRQRVCIARAIATRPNVIVADEAVSALDVSIRAQILSLFHKLTQELNLASIFITHDLSVVRSLCENVAVMYLGQIVEKGSTEDVFKYPFHPYSLTLLESSPIPDPEIARRPRQLRVEGEVPSPVNPPPGCRFHTRCPDARQKCREVMPRLRAHLGREVACHYPLEWGNKERTAFDVRATRKLAK